MTDLVGLLLLIGGAGFFVCGTIGLLRFPDVYTRLHALTKADNLGLGCLVLGLGLVTGSWLDALKLLLVWAVTMIGSAASCHLIAQAALAAGVRPWTDQ